jgi:hypothetical protein
MRGHTRRINSSARCWVAAYRGVSAAKHQSRSWVQSQNISPNDQSSKSVQSSKVFSAAAVKNTSSKKKKRKKKRYESDMQILKTFLVSPS